LGKWRWRRVHNAGRIERCKIKEYYSITMGKEERKIDTFIKIKGNLNELFTLCVGTVF